MIIVLVQRCHNWVGLLVGSLLRKLAYCLLVPWKLVPRGDAVMSHPSWGLGSVSKVHSFFNTRDSPSSYRRQPWATAIAYDVLGVFLPGLLYLLQVVNPHLKIQSRNFLGERTCNVCLSLSGLLHSLWSVLAPFITCKFHDFNFLYSWVIFYTAYMHFYLSVDGHWCCFHFVPIMNTAVIDMSEHVSVEEDLESFEHMLKSGTSEACAGLI